MLNEVKTFIDIEEVQIVVDLLSCGIVEMCNCLEEACLSYDHLY